MTSQAHGQDDGLLKAEACEIVTEWLGMFDPPPQIDFQQSEFLQQAIANALAIPRTPAPDARREALAEIIRMDDEAKEAHGKPGANLNGLGLVDLFDCVGHPFGVGEHKQQPYRSNQLEAALSDARAALAPSPAVAAETVAWRYELAHCGWDKESYGHWNWHLSETKPHVPEGSIRNLTPLYASPPLRGERELLEQCAKIARQFELDLSKSQLDDRDIEMIRRGANEASEAIEQAILSLQSSPAALSPTSGASTGGGDA